MKTFNEIHYNFKSLTSELRACLPLGNGHAYMLTLVYDTQILSAQSHIFFWIPHENHKRWVAPCQLMLQSQRRCMSTVHFVSQRHVYYWCGNSDSIGKAVYLSAKHIRAEADTGLRNFIQNIPLHYPGGATDRTEGRRWVFLHVGACSDSPEETHCHCGISSFSWKFPDVTCR